MARITLGRLVTRQECLSTRCSSSSSYGGSQSCSSSGRRSCTRDWLAVLSLMLEFAGKSSYAIKRRPQQELRWTQESGREKAREERVRDACSRMCVCVYVCVRRPKERGACVVRLSKRRQRKQQLLSVVVVVSRKAADVLLPLSPPLTLCS